MDKLFLTAEDVAALLNTSRDAIYQKMSRKEFPENTFIKFGKRRLLFVKDDLLKWIQKGGAVPA